jgi:hypothetical protein
LTERVADRVLESTYGRIRGLAVEEVKDEIVVRGDVPSHHMRQLALEGALTLVPVERCRPIITVGMSRA